MEKLLNKLRNYAIICIDLSTAIVNQLYTYFNDIMHHQRVTNHSIIEQSIYYMKKFAHFRNTYYSVNCVKFD